MDPTNPDLLWTIAYVHGLRGDFELAAGFLARLEAVDPEFVYAHQLAALVHGAMGNMDAARAHLTPAVRAAAAGDHHLALHLAESYAITGDTAEAIVYFRIAIDHGFVHYPFFSQHNPHLALLHGEPEFESLLARAEAEWRRFATVPIPLPP